MRANKNKIIASLNLISMVLGLVFFCRVAFLPIQASASIVATENNKNAINNYSSACESTNTNQTHKKTNQAPQPKTPNQNNSTGNAIPSCCYTKTIPNQITLVEQNFSKKLIHPAVSQPTFFLLPQIISSFKISSTDHPLPETDQLNTVIKRE